MVISARLTATIALAAATLGAPAPTGAADPVVGYITIVMKPGDLSPTWNRYGVLADTSKWTCSAPAWDPPAPYRVTCSQVVFNPDGWKCSVLHADITTGPSGVGRTSMDCQGDNVFDARTRRVERGDRDFAWAPADMWVGRHLVCEVDDGNGRSPVPEFAALCGDPPSLMDVLGWLTQ